MTSLFTVKIIATDWLLSLISKLCSQFLPK